MGNRKKKDSGKEQMNDTKWEKVVNEIWSVPEHIHPANLILDSKEHAYGLAFAKAFPYKH